MFILQGLTLQEQLERINIRIDRMEEFITNSEKSIRNIPNNYKRKTVIQAKRKYLKQLYFKRDKILEAIAANEIY